MSSKFKVGESYRNNPLSKDESPISVEVYYSDNRSTRVYDNVHFPNKFAEKIFNRDPSVSHVIVKDSSNSSETSISRSEVS